MSNFPLKIPHHTNSQEEPKLNEKKKVINRCQHQNDSDVWIKFSEKDFKVAIIKMLQRQLQTWVKQIKNRKFYKRNIIYKENPMENFKWKNTITTLRNSIDRTIEMTKPEQKREHILEKKK